MKYGIFSEVVLLPGESRKHQRSLLKDLRDALQPEGGLEEALVEKVASQIWRHRRFLIAESAEIRQGSEFVEWDQKNRKEERSGVRQTMQNPVILKTCLELLCELRQKIESSSFDRKRDTAILEKICESDSQLGKMLLERYLRTIDVAELPDKEREGFATPAECKSNILDVIDKEIHLCQIPLVEGERTKLEVLRHSVPESERLDRLLRYEASLERSFDRTLNQLERMQRLRRGQAVAPRIDVTVSR